MPAGSRIGTCGWRGRSRQRPRTSSLDIELFVDTAFHELSDDALLAQCEKQTHRGSGPGGQHRNTTDTAVRLVHKPTGVVAEGKDQRSQLSNIRAALGRLREKLEKRAYRPPPRKKTRPSRGAKERRLFSKKLNSQKKAMRRDES